MRSLLAASLLGVAAARLNGAGSLSQVRGEDAILGRDLASMRPEVVAHLLVQVEHSWEARKIQAMNKEVSDEIALAEMQTSCVKVAGAIVSGSSGDQTRVVEYMQDVCSEDKDSQSDSEMCQKFALGIDKFMNGDLEFNRNDLDLSKFCQTFYESSVAPAAAKLKEKQDLEAATAAAEAAKAAKATPAPVAQNNASDVVATVDHTADDKEVVMLNTTEVPAKTETNATKAANATPVVVAVAANVTKVEVAAQTDNATKVVETANVTVAKVKVVESVTVTKVVVANVTKVNATKKVVAKNVTTKKVNATKKASLLAATPKKDVADEVADAKHLRALAGIEEKHAKREETEAADEEKDSVAIREAAANEAKFEEARATKEVKDVKDKAALDKAVKLGEAAEDEDAAQIEAVAANEKKDAAASEEDAAETEKDAAAIEKVAAVEAKAK